MNTRASILLFCLLSGCGQEADPTQAPEPLDEYALAQPVEIRIDAEGVPHLYAKSDLDAFFAEGYQVATDSLFALEVTRRASVGRLAEVLGDAQLESDLQAHTFGFVRWGEASAELLRRERPEVYNAIVAYVGGVNRRIAEVDGTGELPKQFVDNGFGPEPWTPNDVLAIGVRIQFGFSHTLSFDLLNTLVDNLVEGRDALPIFAPYRGAFFMSPDEVADWQPPLDARARRSAEIDAREARALFRALSALYTNHGIGEGSNNWVLSGDYTDNGRPYLANDSHAGFTSPNRMHLHHLDSASAGGTLDVIGFSFLGVPAVQVGHNRHVAWGATTNFADMMDVWEVQVDGDEVLVGGERVPLDRRTERVRVKADDGTIEEQDFEVRSVAGYGVLLPDAVLPVPKVLITSGELLVGWPGFSATDELAQFLGFDRARDLDDFEAAVGLGRTGMQNWVSASAEGIRMRAHGRVPDRGPVDGRPRANAVLDGSDPSTLWTGALLPAEHLPSLDGSQPFIVTANNDPWGHTADNDPLNDEFYYGSFYAPGIRARRLTDWFAARIGAGSVSREELQVLQNDVTSTFAVELVPLVAEAVAAIGTDPDLAPFENRPELAQATAALSAWDGRMVRTAPEAALLRLFTAYLSRATLEPSLGPLFDGIDEAQPVTVQKLSLLVHMGAVDAVLGGKQRVLLVQALSDALAVVSARASGAAYTWGDLHRAVFRDMIGGESLVPTDGDDSTINVAQCHCWKDGAIDEHCRSTAGAVYRIVVGFDEDGTPRGTFDTPEGNAGSTEDWVEGRYVPLHFRRTDVEANTASSKILSPLAPP